MIYLSTIFSFVTCLRTPVKEKNSTKWFMVASPTQVDERRRVLGMQHMLGAFYIMLLGFGLAFSTLLGELLSVQ